MNDEELMEAYYNLRKNKQFKNATLNACYNSKTCSSCQYNPFCSFDKLIDGARSDGLDVFETINNAKKYFNSLNGGK